MLSGGGGRGDSGKTEDGTEYSAGDLKQFGAARETLGDGDGDDWARGPSVRGSARPGEGAAGMSTRRSSNDRILGAGGASGKSLNMASSSGRSDFGASAATGGRNAPDIFSASDAGVDTGLQQTGTKSTGRRSP